MVDSNLYMIKLLSILPLLLLNIVFSDCNNLEIRENSFDDSIVGIYLSAIDLNTGASTVQIFDYSVIVPQSSTCDNFKINYKIYMLSPDLGFNSNFLFASGGFNVSEIPAGTQEVQFKNTDLSFSTSILKTIPSSIGAKFEMEPGISVHADNENIRAVIMQTGKIPNGTYTFEFFIENSLLSGISKTVEIYEPITFELVSPGEDFSSIEENIISSTYPVFQWYSDYCPRCNIGIRVSEFDLERHSSPLEALNDISSLPSLQSEEFYFFNNSQSYSFQYPINGALDLKPGKSYVWQLVRQYKTTQGLSNDLSEIFAFKIKDVNFSKSSYNTSDQLYREKLILLLGESKFQELFNVGGELSGVTIKDIEIKLNGAILSSDEIEGIIEKIQNQQLQIKSYQIK